MDSPSPQPATPPAAPTPPVAGPGERVGGAWIPSTSLLITLALLAAVVVLQWPMLKGLVYRAGGIEAPPSAVSWRGSFDSAIEEAQEGEKPLLLVFSASWCPPCNAMKHEVWADAEVGQTIDQHYVPVHIDVDDPQVIDVVTRYQVRSIPAVMVVDGQGQVIKRAAYMSPSETLSFLSADDR